MALMGLHSNWLTGSYSRDDGQLVTRVAMGVDVLSRLYQQIQQVLVGMRDARQPKTRS